MKCDGTGAETRFGLSAKRTRPFKSARASVVSTTGSRGVRISGSNGGYTRYRGAVMRCEGDWLRTPFASFPITFPPVRHRVPSRFSWTLLMFKFCCQLCFLSVLIRSAFFNFLQIKVLIHKACYSTLYLDTLHLFLLSNILMWNTKLNFSFFQIKYQNHNYTDRTVFSHVKFLCTSQFGKVTLITPLKLTYT